MKFLKKVKGKNIYIKVGEDMVYVLNDCGFSDKIEIPKGCKISYELSPSPPVEVKVDKTYELSLYQKRTFIHQSNEFNNSWSSRRRPGEFYNLLSSRRRPKGYVLHKEILEIEKEFFPDKPEKYRGKTFRINFPVEINNSIIAYQFDFNIE